MFKPNNIQEAERFEHICKQIVAVWERLPQVAKAQEKLQHTEYYQHVMHAEWILSTLSASDQLNRDLFMEITEWPSHSLN